MKWLMLAVCAGFVGTTRAQTARETDRIATAGGELKITFFGHASLGFEYGGKAIYVDPWTQQGDYTKAPRADAILVTHEHFDHLDPVAIRALRATNTEVVLTAACASQVAGGVILTNGATRVVAGVKVEAVPAYNLVHLRPDRIPFHPKGAGNGYVLTFGDQRVYVAGDTENTPEMKALQKIDIAFLPMNLPFTMTPEMVADAAKAFRPKILYPYHYAETDTARLTALLKDAPEIEVRVRKLP
jgi:L-ascorbate metabolism protein UlaG (beta-lactamase superfamily)